MAVTPEENRSRDEDRSTRGSKLFHWFLLPLLSFCSCGRKEGNCDTSVNKDSLECNGPIDKQPCARPPPSDDQLKLSDLPLLPLLKICEHLRTEGICKDLDNFRKTCRTFAIVVNAFMENNANLRVVRDVVLTIKNGGVKLYVDSWKTNFLIHPPMTALHADFMMPHLFPTTSEDFYLYNNEQGIESATTSHRGHVDILRVYFGHGMVVNVEKILKLLSNYVSRRVYFGSVVLTDQIAAFILAVVRAQKCSEVDMRCETNNITNFPAFLKVLDSMTTKLNLHYDGNCCWPEAIPLFGRSDAFWYKRMKQKLRDGYKIRYNYRESFTASSTLRMVHGIHQLEWHK